MPLLSLALVKLGQVRALTLESIKVMLVDSTSAKFEWW